VTKKKNATKREVNIRAVILRLLSPVILKQQFPLKSNFSSKKSFLESFVT
jgi:hypothetical protein